MTALSPTYALLVTLFLGLVALAALTDLSELRIPNRICVAIVGLYPAYVLAGGAAVDWQGAIVAAAVVFALASIWFMCGWMGGGDVKLLSAIALWAGPVHAFGFLYTTILLGGGMALLMMGTVRFAMAGVCQRFGATAIHDRLLDRSIPYGVAIAGGAYLTVGRALLAG